MRPTSGACAPSSWQFALYLHNRNAIEPVEAIAFDGPPLRAALREDPVLAQALYPRLLVAVSRRLNATRLQLLDLFAAEQVRTW